MGGLGMAKLAIVSIFLASFFVFLFLLLVGGILSIFHPFAFLNVLVVLVGVWLAIDAISFLGAEFILFVIIPKGKTNHRPEKWADVFSLFTGCFLMGYFGWVLLFAAISEWRLYMRTKGKSIEELRGY